MEGAYGMVDVSTSDYVFRTPVSKRTLVLEDESKRDVRARLDVDTSIAPWAALQIKAPRPSSPASSHDHSSSCQRVLHSQDSIVSSRTVQILADIVHVDTDEQPCTPRASSSGLSMFTPTKRVPNLMPSSGPSMGYLGLLPISAPAPRAAPPAVSGSPYGIPDRMCSGPGPPMMASPMMLSRLATMAPLGHAQSSPRTPRISSTASLDSVDPFAAPCTSPKSPFSPGRWYFPGRMTLTPGAGFSTPTRNLSAAAGHYHSPQPHSQGLPAASPGMQALASPRASRSLQPSLFAAAATACPQSPRAPLPGSCPGASPFVPYRMEPSTQVQPTPVVLPETQRQARRAAQGQLPSGQRLRALVLVASLASMQQPEEEEGQAMSPDDAEAVRQQVPDQQVGQLYKTKVAEAFHDWLRKHPHS